jgi:uncharacterized protein with HEPN domain
LEPKHSLSKSETKSVIHADSLGVTLYKGRMLVALGKRRFDEDWIVQDAAFNCVIQLADDVKGLPKSFIKERTEISEQKVIGMRNIVTREYVSIDPLTVWATIEREFPEISRSLFVNTD